MKRSLLTILAGIALLVGTLPAADKKPPANAAVKATMMFDGVTYRLVNALAWSMTTDEQKRTVVVLSEKPLNAAQLRASLKKNGNADDFDPPHPRLELVFDEKGMFHHMWIQTQDGGIRNLPAGDIKDHKANVTISDSEAKGTVATAKEMFESLTKHKYSFEVTFDLKLTKP